MEAVLNKVDPPYSDDKELVFLPEVALTKDGWKFYPRADVWNLSSATFCRSFDFSSFPIGEMVIRSLKATLLWYCEHRSLHRARNLYWESRSFFEAVANQAGRSVDSITAQHIVNYRAALGKKNEWRLSSLRSALILWTTKKYPGIDPEAIRVLKKMRLKGNVKALAVMTLDPEHGPFTDIELEGIQFALKRRYSDGNMEMGNYLMVWLCMLLGARPIQLSMLKVCDVHVGQDAKGNATCILKLPRAKQQGTLHREAFRDRIIAQPIGRILQNHAKIVESNFRDRLSDPSQAPLFPLTETRREKLNGFAFHPSATYIARQIKEAV